MHSALIIIIILPCWLQRRFWLYIATVFETIKYHVHTDANYWRQAMYKQIAKSKLIINEKSQKTTPLQTNRVYRHHIFLFYCDSICIVNTRSLYEQAPITRHL